MSQKYCKFSRTVLNAQMLALLGALGRAPVVALAITLPIAVGCSDGAKPPSPEVAGVNIEALSDEGSPAFTAAKLEVFDDANGKVLSQPLDAESGRLGASVKLPPGIYTFQITAHAESEVYRGSVRKAVSAGETTTLIIYLTSDRVLHSEGSAPVVDGLAITPSVRVAPGEGLAFEVLAHDPDGQLLTFRWEGSGIFSSPNAPATQWTAPLDEGATRLMVSVSDADTTIQATLDIEVTRAAGAKAKVGVATRINHPPSVRLRVAGEPQVGKALDVSAIVDDPDAGDLTEPATLTVGSCRGSAVNVGTNFWRLLIEAAGPSETCVLEAKAQDSHGGQGSARQTVAIGGAVLTVPPELVWSSQVPGDILRADGVALFSLAARDPTNPGAPVQVDWQVEPTFGKLSSSQQTTDGLTVSEASFRTEGICEQHVPSLVDLEVKALVHGRSETVTEPFRLQLDCPVGHTPAGKLVPVSVSPDVFLRIGEVTSPGVGTARLALEAPPPPVGYVNGAFPMVYDLHETASFTASAGADVYIDYTKAGFKAPESARMFHRDKTGEWVDVTLANDPDRQVAYGRTEGFSLFAVFEAEPANAAPPAPRAPSFSCTNACDTNFNQCAQTASRSECESAKDNCMKQCNSEQNSSACHQDCGARGKCGAYTNTPDCQQCINACGQANASRYTLNFGQLFRGTSRSHQLRFESPWVEPSILNPRGKSTMYVSFDPPDPTNPTRGCATRRGIFDLNYGCRFELKGDNGLGSGPEGQDVNFMVAPPFDYPLENIGLHDQFVYIYHEHSGELLPGGRQVIRLVADVLSDQYEKVASCDREISMSAGWSSKTETGSCDVWVPATHEPIGGAFGRFGIDPAHGYTDPWVEVKIDEFHRVEALEVTREAGGRHVIVDARIHRPSRNRSGAKVRWHLSVFAKRAAGTEPPVLAPTP